MRTVVILICSLSLALLNASGQQEPQGAKGKKKAAPTQQGAQQGAKPAGKPQPNKPPGALPKTAEYGKAKGGGAHPNQPKKPAEYGKVKGQGQPAKANKPAEVGKTKGQAQVANANKPAEMGKAKGAGKRKATERPANAGQPAGPNAAKVGKPGKAGVAAGKPIKPQHFNVPKQPNTAKAPPVKFQQGKHIEGSQNWQGASYTVFRNYTPVWHDQGWWHSHHNRIVFVFGAPYYWNAGYWFPAWGYYPNAYYAWDGPIYAYNNLPPDQVIANVQATLQRQGYYHGEVDGLIGPLTREAIASYQRDHGLYETASIDEPTLQSLGMA
jgi:Putative peptidoglycan binding domain